MHQNMYTNCMKKRPIDFISSIPDNSKNFLRIIKHHISIIRECEKSIHAHYFSPITTTDVHGMSLMHKRAQSIIYFDGLLNDYLVFLEQSIINLEQMRPQIAFALIRRPIIDTLYYLELFLVDEDKALNTIHMADANEKSVDKNKIIKVIEKLNTNTALSPFLNTTITNLRISEDWISTNSMANKALHIATSTKRNAVEVGNLNFWYLPNEALVRYSEHYLLSVTPIVIYSVAVIQCVCERLFNLSEQNIKNNMDHILTIKNYFLLKLKIHMKSPEEVAPSYYVCKHCGHDGVINYDQAELSSPTIEMRCPDCNNVNSLFCQFTHSNNIEDLVMRD